MDCVIVCTQYFEYGTTIIIKPSSTFVRLFFAPMFSDVEVAAVASPLRLYACIYVVVCEQSQVLPGTASLFTKTIAKGLPAHSLKWTRRINTCTHTKHCQAHINTQHHPFLMCINIIYTLFCFGIRISQIQQAFTLTPAYSYVRTNSHAMEKRFSFCGENEGAGRVFFPPRDHLIVHSIYSIRRWWEEGVVGHQCREYRVPLRYLFTRVQAMWMWYVNGDWWEGWLSTKINIHK